VTGFSHRFGGVWTADKLRVLRQYLNFYTTALKGQSFELVYIDAFAGTGRCTIRGRASGEDQIDGSAKIALDCMPPFHRLQFIEKKAKHYRELLKLQAEHANGDRVQISNLSASDSLPSALRAYDWKKTRGVLFLDPYGLQCSWPMLQQINDTHALDVFFLVSVSGLFRQAAVDQSRIDECKAKKLTDFLGTNAWRHALYNQEQPDLFGEPKVTRATGWNDIVQFTTERLRTLFPYVADPQLLGGLKGPPLFALYFAVANPSPKALGLARRVHRDILSRLV
jgi:three-Cys-motif partner protein